jgi:hypothetical protein
MTKMTEHERALVALLFRVAGVLTPAEAVQPQVDALLAIVRATALRDAAKALKEQTFHYADYANVKEVECWLFDRADDIETGRL